MPAFEEAFFISTQRERLVEGRRRSSSPRLRRWLGCTTSRRSRSWSAASACRSPRPSSPPRTPSWLRRSSASTATSGAPSSRAAGSTCSPTPGRWRAISTRPTVHPTPELPWLIQPFVEGETVCTYSTVHAGHGQLAPHVPDPPPVAPLDRDPVRVDRRDRVAAPDRADRRPSSATPGRSRSTSSSPTPGSASSSATRGRPTVRCCWRRTRSRAGCSTPTPTPSCSRRARRRSSTWRWSATRSPTTSSGCRETIRDLARVKDAGDGWHDPLPTLYSAFSFAHFAGVSHSEHAQLQDAMDADMTWDGEPIRGMSDADAKLLAELTARLSTTAKRDPAAVDQEVDRVGVAALDEALVPLVAGRVEDADRDRRDQARGGRTRGPAPRSTASPAPRTR